MAGGSARRWRGEAGREAAHAAREAAAQAFLEVDSLQRDVRINVETVSASDNSPGARRAIADFAAISQRVDAVSTAYINALDAVDLDAEDLSPGAAQQARQQLENSRQQLLQAKAELERFNGFLDPLLTAAAAQLAQVAPAVERAKQAWLAASNALDAAKAARLGTEAQARQLAELSPKMRVLTEGAGKHGVQTVLSTAADVQRTAETIRAEAERLPQQAAEIDKALASLRTRTQALETRSQQVDPVLSELRRRFSEACWRDLQQVPAQAQDAARQALARLTEAEKARNEQRFADAQAIIGTTRTLLATADGSVAVANDRLRALNEAQRAPQAEVEKTRFAIRDAQRLAMAGRNSPDPRHAQPLDQALERLARAEAALTGVHPDYWHFLTETAAIRETAAGVVQAIREGQGMPRR